MPKKACVIYNPAAGRKTFGRIDVVCKSELNKHKWIYDWHVSSKKSCVDPRLFVDDRYDVVIVVGGDGTVRMIAEALLKAGSRIPLAIIPSGSGNLFAHSLGIPLAPRSAMSVAMSGRVREIDVGLVNQQNHFFVAAGCGYDGVLMRRTNRRLKRLIGFFAYVAAFLRTFFSFRRTGFHVTVDGKIYRFKARMVLIINTLNVFGFGVTSDRFNDGMFDIVIADADHALDVIRVFYDFYRKKMGKNLHFLSGRNILVRPTRKRSSFQIDGECVRLSELRVEMDKRKLRVVA